MFYDNSYAKKYRKLLQICGLIVVFLLSVNVQAGENAEADVVVIVDTSTSMKEPGMDPERASLLVTQLLSDIVPGNLAVIRLLDLFQDKNLLPSRPTNESVPCSEDPKQSCSKVEQTSDWLKDARAKQFGALMRSIRGDLDYKKNLENHLQQEMHNSMFDLAFQAALGVFDSHSQKLPRTVIWLSDGHSDNEASLKHAIDEVKTMGAGIEAIVFGAGDLRLPHEVGVDAVKVSNPAEIMKAFANAFRRIVQAPYRIDNLVAANPGFEMKRNTQEAWIVVYGDQTLGDVTITGAGTTQKADYAEDVLPSAGAYKVAYLQHPAAGQWQVNVQGGGQGAAYAVIQRSDLKPILLKPKQTLADTQVALVAGISTGSSNEIITDADVLKNTIITATVQGQMLSLMDNGQQGDEAANDGNFTGLWTFSKAGQIPVQLHLKNDIADSITASSVDVSGSFSYKGGALDIDLGSLGVAAEACRPVTLHAEHQGDIEFELKSLKSLPLGHALLIHTASGELPADGKSLAIKPEDSLQVCLKTQDRAESSEALGEPWLTLQVAGGQKTDQQVTLNLRWQVHGLTFWALWGWLIMLILLALAVLFIILGFILPQRFRGALAVTFVPDRDELDEQSPQPVKQWQGVGIGFYRNARAYLHADYRLSGKAKGALVGLFAENGGNKVIPCNGNSVYRETLDGDWEAIPQTGGRCRPGDIYRIGSNGPYFRISVRG